MKRLTKPTDEQVAYWVGLGWKHAGDGVFTKSGGTGHLYLDVDKKTALQLDMGLHEHPKLEHKWMPPP